MIDPVQITLEERHLLLQHFRKGGGLTHERAQAVLWLTSGKSVYDIAGLLFRDEKTIREWIKAFTKARISSLFPKYRHNSNASKLTFSQREEIKKVLSSPPSDLGLPVAFWDVSTLRNYLVAHFGVVYESLQSYHFLFKISNFSFKLPSPFDLHRNEKQIKKRVKEIRGEIAPFLGDPSWEVLVSDETRIVWQAIIRRAWLPKGEKTVIKVHRENLAQNFVGFLNLRDGRPHLFPVPWQNQKETIKILKLLKKKYPNKRICLLWDNAPWHRGKIVKEKLKTDLKGFYLIAFPPYAPDINPQEHVWKWGKDQVSNTQFSSLAELTRSFRRSILGRNYPYQI